MHSLPSSSGTSYPQRTSSPPRFSVGKPTASGSFKHVVVTKPSFHNIDILSPYGVPAEQVTRSDSGNMIFDQGSIARAVIGNLNFSVTAPTASDASFMNRAFKINKPKTKLTLQSWIDGSHKEYKLMTDGNGDLYINLGKVDSGTIGTYALYRHVGIKIASSGGKDALLSPQGDPNNTCFLKAITELIQNPDTLKQNILDNMQPGEYTIQPSGLTIKAIVFFQDVSNLRRMQDMAQAITGSIG